MQLVSHLKFGPMCYSNSQSEFMFLRDVYKNPEVPLNVTYGAYFLLVNHYHHNRMSRLHYLYVYFSVK